MPSTVPTVRIFSQLDNQKLEWLSVTQFDPYSQTTLDKKRFSKLSNSVSISEFEEINFEENERLHTFENFCFSGFETENRV